MTTVAMSHRNAVALNLRPLVEEIVAAHVAEALNPMLALATEIVGERFIEGADMAAAIRAAADSPTP